MAENQVDLFLDQLADAPVKDERERRGFDWIEDWWMIERINRNGQRVMGAVEVTLNRWMFNACLTSALVGQFRVI